MEKKSTIKEGSDGSNNYEIRIKGHLQDRFRERFEDMTLIRENDGTTTLFGPLPDQTALHSILLTIRNLNLNLISVRHIEQDWTEKHPNN